MNPSPFNADCLKGQVALVTGGGSGICFEICNQLLQHGAAGAVICGRRESFLERSSKLLTKQSGSRCLYKVCDVRDPKQCLEAVDYCVEQFGKLDILVNGAAGNFLAEASTLSPKGFATVMAIDAQGTFNMCSAAFSALQKPKQNGNGNSGVIINISATLQYGATWWQSHPSAAKAAVDSLTRSLALEWGPDKIRVVGIAPGATADTPGTTKLAPGLDSQSMEELVVEGIPLGRMGSAQEMGLAAVFLCTSQYVTGHVLVVDGGEWLYRPQLIPKDVVAELSRKVEAKSRAHAPKAML
ncbi:Peroxisomal 2,4-dienoyl-CoA reductase [Seminavis robusta]|uniref:2,4-dienoyl-CoA reductase [(3E)-enoyl-CoA-producing] n=1 Tax=Seminavis robusta TaxID=568900 RepID=A0A9N8D8U6_9STRA|nr:Peroxisomal 2,4-dienoyl-CoA reductase [Seminavis robusta]|eukprot:Sro4_g003240.1 Peroxisomal 2,4-dienoyl-CoA reductase (298) ;mRNA; r:93207-94406